MKHRNICCWISLKIIPQVPVLSKKICNPPCRKANFSRNRPMKYVDIKLVLMNRTTSRISDHELIIHLFKIELFSILAEHGESTEVVSITHNGEYSETKHFDVSMVRSQKYKTDFQLLLSAAASATLRGPASIQGRLHCVSNFLHPNQSRYENIVDEYWP